MKKISSAIFIAAFLALIIGCKNNVDKVDGGDKKGDAASIFYQSIINLGNGFIDVFNAFSGLVADAFSKADPKKSDVKTYFESITTTLKSTKTKLEDMSKEKAGEEKKSAIEGIADVVKTVGAWLDELIKAAEGGAKAAGGGGTDKIGNVATGAGGANADDKAVKGIATAMKGIVEAAKKVEGVKFEPGAAAEAAGEGNKKAGKLFGTAGAGADAGDAKDAAAAVGAVSGKQILNAIVKAAGDSDQAGKAADAAKNAIQAAIGAGGGAAEFGTDDGKIGKKNDQIAAAIVLRGVAKDGKFGAGANEQEKEVKAVVESAVVKTFGALSDLVREAVEGGVKKVSKVIQEAGKKSPTTSDARKDAGGSSATKS